jgi:hypothetical protein
MSTGGTTNGVLELCCAGKWQQQMSTGMGRRRSFWVFVVVPEDGANSPLEWDVERSLELWLSFGGNRTTSCLNGQQLVSNATVLFSGRM